MFLAHSLVSVEKNIFRFWSPAVFSCTSDLSFVLELPFFINTIFVLLHHVFNVKALPVNTSVCENVLF